MFMFCYEEETSDGHQQLEENKIDLSTREDVKLNL